MDARDYTAGDNINTFDRAGILDAPFSRGREKKADGKESNLHFRYTGTYL